MHNGNLKCYFVFIFAFMVIEVWALEYVPKVGDWTLSNGETLPQWDKLDPYRINQHFIKENL